MSNVSSTFWAYWPVHSEERAISLSLKVCHTNQGSLVIVSGQELSPTHASLRSQLDHDYYFELPCERGAGYPINFSVFYFTPWRFPGCPACELTFFHCS